MYNMISVSTRHISSETARWLDGQGEVNAMAHRTRKLASIHIGSHGFGWFVYCHDEFGDDYPEDLVALLTWARKNGAEYINIDADGEEHAGLQIHEW